MLSITFIAAIFFSIFYAFQIWKFLSHLEIFPHDEKTRTREKRSLRAQNRQLMKLVGKHSSSFQWQKTRGGIVERKVIMCT